MENRESQRDCDIVHWCHGKELGHCPYVDSIKNQIENGGPAKGWSKKVWDGYIRRTLEMFGGNCYFEEDLCKAANLNPKFAKRDI